MRKSPTQKYQEYLSSLYSQQERDQITAALERKVKREETAIETLKKLRGVIKVSIQRENLCMNDYLILDEKYRLLKKHFGIDDKEAEKIIAKLRVRPVFEQELVDTLNKGRNKQKKKK